MSSISQFDISYSPVEDRILLKVTSTNGDELRLWFTRRITSNILGKLKDSTSAYRIPQPAPEAVSSSPPDPEQTKAQAEFQQQTSAANSNFDEKFVPGTNFPLGEAGIVVNRLDFKADANGPGSHALTLSPLKGKGVTLGVTPDLFNTFFELLERTLPKTGWGLTPGRGNVMELPTAATLQ